MIKFTDFRKEQPPEAGVYLWRVPSTRLKDLVIVFLAEYKLRSAGLARKLWPEFGGWDGWRLTIPETKVEWAPYEGDYKEYSQEVDYLEDVDLEPCPFCGQIPKWKYSSAFGGSGPVATQRWWLKCCDWAGDPRYVDPRDLADERNSALRSGGFS